MAKTDISENIYRAIDTIVDARLQNINFNSTILCTIIDDSKASSGIYIVDNAGVKFQATSLDKNLKVNDQVYVTVPNNDFSAQKIILCKKDDFEEEVEGWRDPLNYLDIKYKFDDVIGEQIIIPQNDGQSSEELLARIFLTDNFQNKLFDDAAGSADPQYENEEQTKNDLLNSGWMNFYTEGENIGQIDYPVLGILKRTIGESPTKTIYRIKFLDFLNRFLPRSQWTVPRRDTTGSNPPVLAPISDERTHFLADEWWQDNSSSIEIKSNQTFYAFYNEKKYQPIYLAGLKNIIFSIDCKSNLYDYNINFGSYGVYCKLYLQNKIDKTNINIQLNMSSNQDFLGDPYNFFDFYTQTAIFDVQNYQDYILNKIEFYAYQNGDFVINPGTSNNYKIQFRNPKIYLGIPKQETIQGYKNYESYFQISGKYYQKLDLVGVISIYESLQKIPPIDTELDSDGPLTYVIGDYYQLTNDTINDPNKIYYYNINGSQSYERNQPPNPKEKKCYEYVEVDSNGKRYVPKLYFKENDVFVPSSYSNIKYYDDLFYQSGWETTHDWVNNKYSWSSTEKVWKLRQGQTVSSEFPATLEPYICYLPGRIINGNVGIISSSESSRPQLGISTNSKEVDLVLSTENNDSSIIINNAKSHIELTNESLDLNFKDNQMLTLSNTNGVKLWDKLNDKNESSFKIGLDNNEQAIILYVKDSDCSGRVRMSIDNDEEGILFQFYNNKNEERSKMIIKNYGLGGEIDLSIKHHSSTQWDSLHLNGQRLLNLAKILNNYSVLSNLSGWNNNTPY